VEQPRPPAFTADEFIAWALEQPEGRFELDNGAVVAMAPERIGHGRAKNRILRALGCGQPLPADAIEVTDPIVVVEVVSPSSRGIDRGVKLASYFSLPSVRHYLIVDTDKRVVIHHRRDEEGRIGVRILREGPLTLDPPGLSVEVQDIFVGP
jgi:Uma2 family endonuclease